MANFFLPSIASHLVWPDDQTLWVALASGTIMAFEVDPFHPDAAQRVRSPQIVFSPHQFPMGPLSYTGVHALAVSPVGGEWSLSFGYDAVSYSPQAGWGHWRYQDPVWALAYSLDGAYVATGNSLGSVTIRTSDFFRQIGAYHRKHPTGINSLAWSSDSQIVSGDLAGGVKLWNPWDGAGTTLVDASISSPRETVGY